MLGSSTSRLFKFKKRWCGAEQREALVRWSPCTHRDNLLHIPLPPPREVVQLNKLRQIPLVDVEGRNSVPQAIGAGGGRRRQGMDVRGFTALGGCFSAAEVLKLVSSGWCGKSCHAWVEVSWSGYGCISEPVGMQPQADGGAFEYHQDILAWGKNVGI